MWSRFWGLMWRRSLPEGEGLLIDPCGSIHTMFMRFSIDVVFLDAENRITRIAESLQPFRVALGKGGRRVLEMQAGTARRAGLSVGDRLELRRVEE
jgi:uncharacterized membrane protein (UPF0127 family)